MKKVLNVGCGQVKLDFELFKYYKEIRLDTDENSNPDIIGSIVDMKGVKDESIDAIWASHVIEHIYWSELPKAFEEIKRVLKPSGFAIILTPNLAVIADFIKDDLTKTIYMSPYGPVTPLDILYGFREYTKVGMDGMSHKMGFNTKLIQEILNSQEWPKGKIYTTEYDIIAIFGKKEPDYKLIEKSFVKK
jgi:predicted SAM-dependent methyltransferase